LAEYERLADQVQPNEDRLRDHLFGPRPYCECLIAEGPVGPVGFALYFFSYSTFGVCPKLYLEDLFVRPEHRGGGHGRGLFRALAKVAVERGCGRLEWSVLDWNESAIGFYRRLGAAPVEGWTVYQLKGEALAALAIS
jgi:GNAT superfamily N-acetyltransferase